jgi:hypothetical protein
LAVFLALVTLLVVAGTGANLYYKRTLKPKAQRQSCRKVLRSLGVAVQIYRDREEAFPSCLQDLALVADSTDPGHFKCPASGKPYEWLLRPGFEERASPPFIAMAACPPGSHPDGRSVLGMDGSVKLMSEGDLQGNLDAWQRHSEAPSPKP